MLFRRVIWMLRRVAYCSRGLYAVQGGYMLFRRFKWKFKGVICGINFNSGQTGNENVHKLKTNLSVDS